MNTLSSLFKEKIPNMIIVMITDDIANTSKFKSESVKNFDSIKDIPKARAKTIQHLKKIIFTHNLTGNPDSLLMMIALMVTSSVSATILTT